MNGHFIKCDERLVNINYVIYIAKGKDIQSDQRSIVFRCRGGRDVICTFKSEKDRNEEYDKIWAILNN